MPRQTHRSLTRRFACVGLALGVLILAVPGWLGGCAATKSSPRVRTSRTGERSVRPGINEGYENPTVDEWIERFEGESREIYKHRQRIVADAQVRPGMVVADIGAGTGLFTPLFSEAVGSEGKVLAVDIVPEFLELIRRRAEERKLTNVSTHLCAEDSVKLEPESVDLAFICDTYHHFEFPKSTMGSLLEALKPGGELVIVEFERIPGESRAWVLNHIRAGRETFSAEIRSIGFELLDEQPDAAYLKENYVARFRKPK